MDFDYQSCGLAETMKVVGSKWTIPILFTLMSGSRRFSQLQKTLDISPRTLSLRLDQLEKNKLVTKKVFAEAPPRTEYDLTERGRSLNEIISKMCQWGEAPAVKKTQIKPS